jgi:23S rRNA (guanine745-N1)-methyltransferase
VLADVVGYLRCPHCSGGLELAGGTVRCELGHSFDVARQGYVNLLPGGSRAGRGDTAEMVAARERFLASGHFDPLAEALAGTAGRVGGDGCVVDLGAGTGWQLARVLDALPDRHGIALDLSPPALRRAARAHVRLGAVGCDIWSALPVRDRVAGLVLDVFAPRNGAEMARVMAPGGSLVVITPTPRHLQELVEELSLLSVDSRKQERLDRELAEHLHVVRAEVHEWEMELSRDEVEAAVAMGPSAVHLDHGTLRRRLETLPERMDVSASVTMSVCERHPR